MSAPRLLAILVVLVAGCGGGDEHLPPVIDAPVAVDAAPDASGRACGGHGGGTCHADEYCDFAANTCGATDEQGTCTPRPTSCPDLLVAIPTCGCDSTVYGQPCEAFMAGTDLNAGGSCPVPAGMFACGYTQCTILTQYCERQVSDVVGEPDTYACRPLPSCPSQFATCTCLATEPCGAQCTGMGTTGLTLTCPGG